MKSDTAVRAARPRKPLSLGFQIRALLPVILCLLLFFVLTMIFVWLPMQAQVGADPSPVVKALLGAQLFRVELWLTPFLLISGGVASTYALLRARRIAQPVADLRERLAKLSLGEAEPLALDPRDEFHELEAPFNAVVSRLDHMKRSDLEMLRLFRRNLEGIAQRSVDRRLTDADLQESIAVLLRDIDAEIKKLQMKS